MADLVADIKKGNIERVSKALVQDPLLAHKKDKFGLTLLRWAAFYGRLDLANELIRMGADVDAKEEEGKTPLHWAVVNGHVEVARCLIANGASLPGDLCPLLFEVVENGQMESVRYLVSLGGDVNCRKGLFPLLAEAADCDNTAMIELLLELGADPVRDGEIAMFRAERYETVLLLISHGARATVTIEGRTPLHNLGEPGRIRLLVEHGADINARDQYGATPLSYAAYTGDISAINTLIDLGADVNIPEDKGTTPLMHGAIYGRKRVVEMLLAAGADKSARDSEGRTAYDWAMRKRYESIAKLLKPAG